MENYNKLRIENGEWRIIIIGVVKTSKENRDK
jgi:hypothetical protein